MSPVRTLAGNLNRCAFRSNGHGLGKSSDFERYLTDGEALTCGNREIAFLETLEAIGLNLHRITARRDGGKDEVTSSLGDRGSRDSGRLVRELDFRAGDRVSG